MELLIWLGVLCCLSQSALLSGMNLACFSVSKLELEVALGHQEPGAAALAALREDSNFLLVTILWANVGVNVLLALLAGSVMTGVAAFLFSTLVITLFGEILPQSWFVRNAMAVVWRLVPVLRVYQWLLWPVARPTAWVLDRWLGQEAIPWFRERELRTIIRLHMAADHSDIGAVEGQGALNFLLLDDILLMNEGEPLVPASILALDFDADTPRAPAFDTEAGRALLQRCADAGTSRVVLTDRQGEPRRVLDVDALLRAAWQDPRQARLDTHSHRPIIVTDPRTPLGAVIGRFRVHPRHHEDDLLDEDVILLWGEQRRIITGADILGRLLRGISHGTRARGGDAAPGRVC
jgi:metal transporter CNNM